MARQSEAVKPEPKEDPTPKVLMSVQDQRIAALVSNARGAKEMPFVTDVNELAPQLLMMIPKGITKPEFGYRWAALDNIDGYLISSGGIWEVVTRSNHSHVDDALFGTSGAILFKGQNILLFTRRQTAELQEQAALRDINKKTEAALDPSTQVRGPEGKVLAHIEQVDDPGEGYSITELTEDGDYSHGEMESKRE